MEKWYVALVAPAPRSLEDFDNVNVAADRLVAASVLAADRRARCNRTRTAVSDQP